MLPIFKVPLGPILIELPSEICALPLKITLPPLSTLNNDLLFSCTISTPPNPILIPPNPIESSTTILSFLRPTNFVL